VLKLKFRLGFSVKSADVRPGLLYDTHTHTHDAAGNTDSLCLMEWQEFPFAGLIKTREFFHSESESGAGMQTSHTHTHTHTLIAMHWHIRAENNLYTIFV